jgi:hypothetical protein
LALKSFFGERCLNHFLKSLVLKALFKEVLCLNPFSEKFGAQITFRRSFALKPLFGEVWYLNHFLEKFGA